ncbi:hypothetical protein [Microseira sp. BLCC-F43]|uniref:hypothetical protein n=1 Tax=Microseira sp. BLCC-F43 TaxID=3153602 RepID=UPI0035BABDD6
MPKFRASLLNYTLAELARDCQLARSLLNQKAIASPTPVGCDRLIRSGAVFAQSRSKK